MNEAVGEVFGGFGADMWDCSCGEGEEVVFEFGGDEIKGAAGFKGSIVGGVEMLLRCGSRSLVS